MKNKIINIIVLIVSVFLLTGCKINQKDPHEVLTDSLNKVVLPEHISSDINLLSSIDGYAITWKSNDESIISNSGKISRKSYDQEVVISASISEGETVVSKDFKIIVDKIDPEEFLNNVLNQIIIPTTVSESIDLPDLIDGIVINWTSNDTSVISNKGKVKRFEEDVKVTLKANVSYAGVNLFRTFEVTVLKDPNYDVINNALAEISIPTDTISNINLPTSIGDVLISWQSSRSLYLTNTGVITRTVEDISVLLTGTFSYNGLKVDKYFDIVILGYSDLEKIGIILDRTEFNETLNSDLVLNTALGYGSVATWTSSNTNVLSNDGKYTYDENVETVKLTLNVKLGEEQMEKEFIFNIAPKEEAKKDHLLITRANEFDSSKFENVVLKDGKLVLADGASQGTYESGIINTLGFESLVASWAAVSSTTSTVELQVKVRVDGAWSDYISYKPFGLGLQNACYDQSNSLIKLSTDEVMVLNNKKGDGVMFKVTLRSTNNTSPELSLVALALEIPGYTYPVDVNSYPRSIVHEVPRLYQGAVPTIGNSICSATSSTMLLKYKGENFSKYDAEYEHRYIAGIVRDYGNKIYGNWVYNTVAMSGYGYDSYVARLYSVNELIEYLATVGPCALSVKGQMNSDKKSYYTNGHLIVAIGYEFKDNGDLVIVCNDPNVPSVECRYTLTVINNTWRNIAYIIE